MTAQPAVPAAMADTREGRRARAVELARLGELTAASRLLAEELRSDGAAWLNSVISQAMQASDLRLAGDLARIGSGLRHGGRVLHASPPAWLAHGSIDRSARDERELSAGKLQHDIDQLRYLRTAGIADGTVETVIASYQQIAAELAAIDPEARRSLSEEEHATIGDIYGRLIHIRPTPRLDRALSSSWDPAAAEDTYLTGRAGLVVIDEFLAPGALAELQAFCLESTVWNANRYAHGRLGAFFDAGFNCPLVMQIAEELRASFPRMIGSRHRLRQLWAFKYPPELPSGSTIHADFAAVNVNFWITPERANLNPSTGGLLIYDVDAPREWDFATYNGRLDLIKEFLRRNQARVTYVPYRENRAIIFDSDLFHATAEVTFRPSYESRRINITMLYGVREQDDPKPRLPGSPPVASSAISSGWRSAAFARTRRLP
jgi:hypothetical protein